MNMSAFRIAIAAWMLGAMSCTQTRPSQSPSQLLALRAASDARMRSDTDAVSDRIVRRAKAQYDEYRSGRRSAPPTIDVLVISGGGDWGAFGAGFLKGWGRVPKSDPFARPEFAAVTGVSTGALIAPFAFLGDDASIEMVVQFYRNPKPDWVQFRGPFYFLPTNLSLAEVPGLEREVRTALSPQSVRRIEEAGADGRLLAVSTTNLDDGSPRVFDLVAESQRARQSGDYDRIRNIVLASAGIPGAFPFRIIDNQMYVDGGVTGNIIYGQRASESDTLVPTWLAMFPEIPVPRIRFWVLFNNQFRPPPQVTKPQWLDVVTRALETSTRASTLTAVQHLASMAQVAQFKWHADVEVRVASIPGQWMPPNPGSFDKATMNQLVDMGEGMGADPKSWRNPLPP